MRLGKKKEVLGQRLKIISGGRYLHGTGAMSLERSRTALEGRDFERVKARGFRDWKL